MHMGKRDVSEAIELVSPTVRYQVLGDHSLAGVFVGRQAVTEHLMTLVERTAETFAALRYEDWMVGDQHVAALVSVHVQTPGKIFEGRILVLAKFDVEVDLIDELTVFFENERAVRRFFDK